MRAFRMMYIDDSPEDLRMVTDIVQRVDGTLQVMPFVHAEAAMLKLEQQAAEAQPDVILLDVHADSVEDHVVLKRLKASVHTRGIPLALVVPDTLTEPLREALAPYADMMIFRPEDPLAFGRLFEDVVQAFRQRLAASS